MFSLVAPVICLSIILLVGLLLLVFTRNVTSAETDHYIHGAESRRRWVSNNPSLDDIKTANFFVHKSEEENEDRDTKLVSWNPRTNKIFYAVWCPGPDICVLEPTSVVAPVMSLGAESEQLLDRLKP